MFYHFGTYPLAIVTAYFDTYKCICERLMIIYNNLLV